MKRTFLSLVSMAFIAAMTLTSCEEIMSAIDNPVGSYVQFNDSVLNLTPGQVAQNEATTISTEKVTYTSSDKSIATVDPNGFVTAISYGEAIITASVPANENYQAGSASYKVKVGSELAKALKEGAIVSFDLNVDGVDESVSFKKVGDNFVIENPMASAPRRAAAIITSYSLGYNKATNIMALLVKQTDGINTAYPLTVIFDLSKNTIQVIPGSPLSTVLFVNIKINGVTITGKLTKKEVAPEAVAITAPATPFVMNVGGDDVTLTAEVTPADATDKKVTWSSSAPAVATVDQTGKVHAVAAGTTTIKATTANGKEASIELTVNLPKATATAPTAKTGVKAGEDKAIIDAGVASGGTMMYAVTTTNTKPTTTDGFSATVPTAQSLAAGTFYVWYYVKADATHADSDIDGSVSVTIQSAAIITKDASETFTPTANTVTGTYFKVSGTKTNDGWKIGTIEHLTITISSPDGLNLSQVVLTVGTHPGTSQRNLSHLAVNHGTLTVTGTTPGNTVTISNINSPSVTLSAPGSNNAASRWTFTQAVVDGKGDASK
jgi:hypothetical protein